jgi:AAA15 family ATPase/GTPase
MIHKIEVENFMSLKKATVNFEPLTIFIGSNGSGKSAVFKATGSTVAAFEWRPGTRPEGRIQ